MTEAWKQWEGQVVNGEFHLRQYLGGSLRSAVFLTEHGDRGLQKAAIKLIPAQNVELQLFQRRQAAKLAHPHLVRLFELGRCQLRDMELLYILMEYAEEDLSQVLPQRPLTPAETHDMLKPTLDALAYVHAGGFVHGHIKPANIMAVGDQAKISSDGMCRVDQSCGPLEEPGVYDPPETPDGTISPAGDIWSLAMTLVESLTQRLPVWEKPEEDPVVPETLPAPFLDIARHCLHRNPEHRWEVSDIAARLQFTSPVPQRQTTARPREGFAKWRYLVPAAAVGLALVVMLAGPRLLHHRPQVPQAPSTVSQPPVQTKPEQRPLPPETLQPTERTKNKGQDSAGSAPSPTELRSGAGAKTPPGGLVQGEVLKQVTPEVPSKASDTIRGTVRVSVRVTVNPLGRVVGAELDSPGPSQYFANLALRAAKQWEFVPPKADGRDVSSEWVLRFEFMRTETKVRPTQVAP